MEVFTDVSVRNYSYMFDFEKEFVFQDHLHWMQQNWICSIYVAILYICIIFGTKHYMQDKPSFNLRPLLIFWNLGLSAFSILAFFRTAPELMHITLNYSFYYSVCESSYLLLDRVSSYWSWLVVLSKAAELGDTVFIVLRKRPLIFLHWYHHIMTLVGVWYYYAKVVPTARWHMVINLFIHSIMYGYYALRAMGLNPPRQISMLITASQIIQMQIGGLILTYVYYQLNNNVPCRISYGTITFIFLIGLSYLILFANYFYQTYVVKNRTLQQTMHSFQKEE